MPFFSTQKNVFHRTQPQIISTVTPGSSNNLEMTQALSMWTTWMGGDNYTLFDSEVAIKYLHDAV